MTKETLESLLAEFAPEAGKISRYDFNDAIYNIPTEELADDGLYVEFEDIREHLLKASMFDELVEMLEKIIPHLDDKIATSKIQKLKAEILVDDCLRIQEALKDEV